MPEIAEFDATLRMVLIGSSELWVDSDTLDQATTFELDVPVH
jgi:hypothetical protein